jgi:hypothetical protein
MKKLGGFYFYKQATNKNPYFVKKTKEILIVHPESSLRMNHPERMKWIKKIPFIIFINFE